MHIREDVLRDALALSPEDRSFVAEQLEQSLDHGKFASTEIAEAWTEEIDRRIAAYDRGDLPASPADESIARMRRFLADHQSRKIDA